MSIKKGTMPPRYDDAFKSGAIKMVTEQGQPSKEVAKKDEVIDVLKKSVKLITILCDHNQHSIGFRRLRTNTCLAFMPRKLLDNE